MIKHLIAPNKLAVFKAIILIFAIDFLSSCHSIGDYLNELDSSNKASADKITSDKKDETKTGDDKKVPEPKIEEIKPPDSGILAIQTTINPTRPQNDVYLGDWRISIFGIDDEGRRNTGFSGSISTFSGAARFELGKNLLPYPIIIAGYNNVLPFACDEERTHADIKECRRFEIFVPPFCYDKALWLIGPVEDAVWRYYRSGALRHGAPWNPNLVDCASWIASLQLLYLTNNISEEMEAVTIFRRFNDEVLLQTFRENQQLLVSTTPPICMAEQRHDGGTMNPAEAIDLPFVLGEGVTPCPAGENFIGFDTIKIGTNGIADNICKINLNGNLAVNSANFVPDTNNKLQSRDFMGTISNQVNTVTKLDITVFNTQLGNGRELDSVIYKNACALTNVIRFDNLEEDEQTLVANTTGTRFSNLFEDGLNTSVFLTSSGDKTIDDTDFWAIFFRNTDDACKEQVMVVELLGHREGDFRDNLHMTYDPATEDLFLGLRANYELGDATFLGSQAFLSYTIHMWDGSTEDGRKQLRQQFAACYLAADPWAFQFFRLNDSEYLRDLLNVNCVSNCPLDFADFAVRSQCFSNSTANQRWQNANAGLWSMNSIKNVTGNIIVTPGWLGPNLDVDVFIQKFDESVFKGPRTIRKTNNSGQLMVEMPTLVEGDRVLIRAQDSCCEDYDLILPCVPQFTIPVGPIGPPLIPKPIPVGPIGPPLVPTPIPLDPI